MTAGAPTVRELLGGWRLQPVEIAPAAAAAIAYGRAALRVRRWPRRRSAAFAGGLAVLLVAQQSGIDAYAADLLSVHMLQHLLLITAAAALLVAGAPATLALRALRGARRAALARIFRGAVVATLTRPVVAWSLFACAVVATHLPAAYDLALREPPVHALEHALYLWSAVLFWTPLLGAEPLRHRLSAPGAVAYLLAAMAPMSLVAAPLLSADAVLYPHYADAAPALGVSALADQRAGATVMWLGGTLALVTAVVACGWAAVAREERAARARERHGDLAAARRSEGAR